jgi:hypothetical protein
MMIAERQKCPTSDEEYDENTLEEVEAKDVFILDTSEGANHKIKR